jgi:hypothetical protein
MSRTKRTRKPKPIRGAARKGARPKRSPRRAISTRARRGARARARRVEGAPAAALPRAAGARPIMAAGWSTLSVVWRPAIAVATLPYRVYRVYRWAEAEQARSASV